MERIHPDADRVTVLCRSRCVRARCPRCRCASTKTHSRYERRIADLPWLGRRVTIRVQVRRLRCINTRCSQRIFGERAEGVVMPYARRTLRLRDLQRCVGVALGGEAGARLTDRLGMPSSPDTLLRLVCDEPRLAPAPPPPRSGRR
ncbi:transposase family protein [Labrys sp. 22185]|uniref:transposase family protein n=1 Tax=Labrys sp. 22185 TaxID=3453888 RepID=UPI003F83B33A